MEGERLTPQDFIDGVDEGGDGRVPRLSSRSPEALLPDSSLRMVGELHGSLQNNHSVREALWGWLAPEPPYHRGDAPLDVALSVRAREFLTVDEPYRIAVTLPDATGTPDGTVLRLSLSAAGPGSVPTTRTLRDLGGGRFGTTVTGLGPGAYRAVVEAVGRRESAVTALLLVMEG